MTPGGSWPGCPAFGIRDLLEMATRKSVDLAVGVHRVNEVLRDLGITDYQLESIQIERESTSEAGSFRAVLVRNSDHAGFWSVKIDRPY